MSDPIQWIDPMGLAGYTGNEDIETIGPVIYATYDLNSQCIDNYEVNVKAKVLGAGVGGKNILPGTSTSGEITFYDNNATLYPRNLDGAWGGANVAAGGGGKGIQFGGTALGSATSNIEKSTNQSTTNASLGTFLGKVVSYQESWKYCGISEEPKCGPGGCFDKKRTKQAPGFSPYPISRSTVKDPAPEARKQEPPANININDINF